jgi:hypothetical protein
MYQQGIDRLIPRYDKCNKIGWLITRHRDMYQQGIERLIPRYDKCNKTGRAYVKKQRGEQYDSV